MQKFIGVDFGVPRSAGAQAQKIILIEAVKQSKNRYAILPGGRNQRLVELPGRHWRSRRRGWTIDRLRDALCGDGSVAAVAFDFPFSLPIQLLKDRQFAALVGRKEAFVTRRAWQAFVAKKLALDFDGDLAGSKLVGLEFFDVWRGTEFWIRRATDTATQASPPLKDKFQSVFNMTLAGASLLHGLVQDGYQEKLDDLSQGRAVMETYPRAVAERMGFRGSYKRQPQECLEAVVEELETRGIELAFDSTVKRFCESYTSGSGDHDGVDAFLCLVTAICFDQGVAELCSAADPEEGAIIAPQSQ